MSDWLEAELSQHLSGVTAPEELRVRLGLARAKRREFPRAALAVAAVVVMGMAGGLAASRTPAGDPRQVTTSPARNGETVEFAAADPGAISVWLGHAAGVAGPQRAAERAGFNTARFNPARFNPARFAGSRGSGRHEGNVAAVEFRGGSGHGTMLAAWAGAVERPGACNPTRNAILSSDGGCVFCHT